eukprot:8565180-Alexandrium_andersonii.AAC.1
MGASGLWRGAAAIDGNIQCCARAQWNAAQTRVPSGMPWPLVRTVWTMHQQHHLRHLEYA